MLAHWPCSAIALLLTRIPIRQWPIVESLRDVLRQLRMHRFPSCTVVCARGTQHVPHQNVWLALPYAPRVVFPITLPRVRPRPAVQVLLSSRPLGKSVLFVCYVSIHHHCIHDFFNQKAR